jgi:type II secretory pathway pseudopilin PulG
MVRFSSARRQGGLVALLLAVAILTTVATTLVIRQASAVRSSGNKIALTNQRLEAIRLSLINFVSVNARLPCPADGAMSTGDPALVPPNGPACNKPDGTVPWSALGIASPDVLDGWGNKFSYRVFVGADNLNNSGGINMRVQNGSAITSLVGFALISHGATGYGAWPSGGGARLTMPNLSNGAETANASVPNPPIYYQLPVTGVSDPTTAPTALTHFDDQVIFMTIADLKSAAGLPP